MTEAIRYRVIGMDCASCAAKIKKAVHSAGVMDFEISTTSQVLSLNGSLDEESLAAVVSAVTDLGYGLEHLPGSTADLPEANQPHTSQEYRRALWIVIWLNVGYGVVEMIGGFLSGSQALKADALDFLGDGLITLLGVFAIGWGLLWRARSALIQGMFLGLLGLYVVIDTLWRFFSQQPVEAGLMGIFGLIALAVNIAAALVLIRHRAGDANVRAVWLFSRNDAIGNAAVVIAALVVAWTGRSWPDLMTAIAIASLFLHSSWVISRDAWREIVRARSSG
ncbi:cation diffusion facilitator family transporter [Aliiroseovarius sp. KMU-50]|uniref:Cation diffusion facilitator family transporter n=1 Tax=Aliiroseovarius salicola TaxID=3009082 RepID=A0ABT4W4X8_9RHOB|nr:cation diffusion facilitator family transporter [Aliiroseovarius sp. KMU-50]MDA5095563.1 cation diffusion facilitator family transporter [Aliiroseovarius sp. KMU-50]